MRVRLLVVDDQPLMVETISRFMEPICSLIHSTDNLRDAVEMASKNEYNLILLDLRLGDTGKEEAFQAIRTLKSFNTSVVVISGIPDEHLKEDALAAGADSFIEKGPDLTSDKLLLAANIAVLHLPKESFKSDSFTQHIALLRQAVGM